MNQFNIANKQDWQLVFEDDLTDSWEKNWFKDGAIARATNSDNGMILDTRSPDKIDNHPKYYAVLWTKGIFEGNIKIEYDFTRLDANPWGVNILYFLASGMGIEPYNEDITKWNNLRRIPLMSLYFNYMKTFHISYAAHELDEKADTYIRFRRYVPQGEVENGLANTDFEPSYFFTKDCLQNQKTHIEVIKDGNQILMKTSTEDSENLYHWSIDNGPIYNQGRIGFRLMANRVSLFKNFKVYVLNNKGK